MSTQNICFHGEMRLQSPFLGLKSHLIYCYELQDTICAENLHNVSGDKSEFKTIDAGLAKISFNAP